MGELDKYLVEVKHANPCAECARNIRDCPWLHSDMPVPGWDARPTRVQMRNMAYQERWVESYEIRSCPLYIPVPPREINNAELTPEQDRMFMRRVRDD